MLLQEFDKYEKKRMPTDLLWAGKFIAEHCQPYLRQNPQLLPLYRGVPDGPMIFTKPVRPNRRPRDSYPSVHKFMNLLVHTAGKTADRTNSVFAIGTKTDTDGTGTDMGTYYGTPYVIFPIGPFHYTWSTMIKDFYVAWDPSKFRIPNEFNIFDEQYKKEMTYFANGRIEVSNIKDPRLNPAVVSNLVGSFKGDDGSLAEAINAKHEIMVQSESILYVQSTLINNLNKILIDLLTM